MNLIYIEDPALLTADHWLYNYSSNSNDSIAKRNTWLKTNFAIFYFLVSLHYFMPSISILCIVNKVVSGQDLMQVLLTGQGYDMYKHIHK